MIPRLASALLLSLGASRAIPAQDPPARAPQSVIVAYSSGDSAAIADGSTLGVVATIPTLNAVVAAYVAVNGVPDGVAFVRTPG